MASNNPNHRLRIVYEMSKAIRRDHETGKAYTDRDFARDYLKSNSSMVAKVLNGNAVSAKTTNAIVNFIRDTHSELKSTVKFIDDIIKKG